MTATLLRQWLDHGRLELPLPAAGSTRQRWLQLSELAHEHLPAARLAEAHVDAVAILAELGAKPAQRHQLWGVWAADAPTATLLAETRSGSGTALTGTKAWCSGARLCTHALVTARTPDGLGGLYAVDLSAPGVHPLPSTWRNPGMAECDTRSVQFTEAAAVAIGEPGQYLARPGFWHGAIGVAACWWGGARAVADPLYSKLRPDDHALAHLGAVDAALAAAEAMLTSAATEVDSDPFDKSGGAQLLARRVRAVVEVAVDEAISRTSRALGPAPLCQDSRHAHNVADLAVYVRQSHAERDLAALGVLVSGRRS